MRADFTAAEAERSSALRDPRGKLGSAKDMVSLSFVAGKNLAIIGRQMRDAFGDKVWKGRT